MILSELKTNLEGLDQYKTIINWNHLHSWRGIYAEVSIDPHGKTLVKEALAEINEALSGKIYEGWKGGDFVYDSNTPVWHDTEGMSEYNSVMGVFPTSDGSAYRIIGHNIREYR